MVKKLLQKVIILFLSLLLSGCSSANTQSTTNGESGELETSSAAENSVNIAAPFKSMIDRLLETYKFPIILPAYLPEPQDKHEWEILPEFDENSFNAEIIQRSPDDDPNIVSNSMHFGNLAGNVEVPIIMPLEENFQGSEIEKETISLSEKLTAEKYIIDPQLHGGTAIQWTVGNWTYFVVADYGEGEFSADYIAKQLVNKIVNSNQSMPGLSGKFIFSQTSNAPYTTIYWEVSDNIWYKLDWKGYPSNAIDILQNMDNII